MLLILLLLQSNITGEWSSLSPFLSFSSSQQPTEHLGQINRYICSKFQTLLFLFFSNSMPPWQMETFWGMKHAGRGWLSAEWRERIPLAEFSSFHLNGAVPRAKCWGGNWARAEKVLPGLLLWYTVNGLDTQVGEGEQLIFFVREWNSDGIFAVVLNQLSDKALPSSLALSSAERMQESGRLMIQWWDDSQIWGWVQC